MKAPDHKPFPAADKRISVFTQAKSLPPFCSKEKDNENQRNHLEEVGWESRLKSVKTQQTI